MLSVKVGNAPASLRASVLAVKAANSDIRRTINQRMRATMNPVWRQRVLAGAHGGMEARMLTPGTRIAAGNPPALVAASGNRKIGRLTPNKHAAGWEFGASDAVRRQSSGRGPNKTYSRHVMRHLPPRNRKGRVVYPAAAEVLPRVASFWAQSAIKTFLDAVEEGQG
ncbi:MAG: hypothetical protein QM711_06100 [Micropruina sp.]|uniref:hypothetical protein n=1 Tax=Micropruina sp. TaxID=2737536 RepID=UPI0039E2FE5C